MKKRILPLLCVLALVLSAAAVHGAGQLPAENASEVPAAQETPAVRETAAPGAYPDVPEDAWYADAVAEMTGKGILKGMDDGTFAPDFPVNRAAVVLVLWRLEGCPELPPAATGEGFSPFPDTEEWFADAANWAKAAGIALGYGGNESGTFGGRDPLTREQLAAFLYRYAQYQGEPVAEGVLKLYPDAGDIHDWALDAMRHAVGMGYLPADDGERLEPTGTALRSELAVVLQRLLNPAMG